MPFKMIASGIVGSMIRSSVAFGISFLKRSVLGKNGSFPNPDSLGSCTKTDVGAPGGTMLVGSMLFACTTARKLTVSAAASANEMESDFMRSEGDSVRDVDQRHNLDFEGQFFLIILSAGVAGGSRLQLDVLEAHIREGILKVGDELA